MEGVVRLDIPLVLCQEIYNKIIGNHQTTLVSKERVLELLQQDEAQHQLEKKNEESDGQNANDGEDSELAREVMDSAAVVASTSTGEILSQEATTESFSKSQNGENGAAEIDLSSTGCGTTDNEVDRELNHASPGGGVSESKSQEDEDDSPLNDGVAQNSSNEESIQTVAEPADVAPDGTAAAEKNGEQPLVAYWAWENTLRTHKMKMHLAKGSDLALHVVLAIVVNQVRYERNAIAMTI